MKTAISLPDEIFARADRMARRLRKSRSQLYREALEEYLLRHDPEAITRAMDEVAARLETGPSPFASEAARRILEGNEW
jgi:predicted transcriptional regulator